MSTQNTKLQPKSDGQKIKVLFLCTGNACRSQMAEGWARSLKGDAIEAFSAGTSPHGVNQEAIQSMARAGIDISAQTSDHIDQYLDTPLDVVISVCDNAKESCPVFPGQVERMHQSFQDPPKLAERAETPEEARACYDQVRDQIRVFVESLI